MPDFKFVERPDSIHSEIAGCSRIGVDTEFMREKTFFAELCLVQIATATNIYCVDPLADRNKTKFWQTLMTARWIVHAGRQDIEVIFQASGRMPSGLFDTQIAAGLLGMAPQLGYASLVSQLLDVEIPKSHTRANWSRRPLPEALLEYAAEDVEYLLPACEILENQLHAAGRLSWAEEDSAALLDPRLYDLDPGQAGARLKGAKHLRGRHRAAAERIAEWRETRALGKNLPRQWILRDRDIIELARRLPSDIAGLADIEGLATGTIRRFGKDLLRIVSESAHVDDATPRENSTEAQRKLMKIVQRRIAERASDLGIAAETIAGRKDISHAIRTGDFNGRLFQGWRRTVIGDELRELLEGS